MFCARPTGLAQFVLAYTMCTSTCAIEQIELTLVSITLTIH